MSSTMTEIAASPAGHAPTTDVPVDARAFDKVRRQMTGRLMMPLFMLFKMPLGFMAGLRVPTLTPERCQTTVPYGWRTTNPFRSTYFAALSMAAELSTGALAAAATRLAPGSFAMLIVGLEAEFGKKATAKTTFTCDDGAAVFQAVRDAAEAGEPRTVRMTSVGRMDDGTEVARFVFTWSFKQRSADRG